MTHSKQAATATKVKRSKPCGRVEPVGKGNDCLVPVLISYHYLRNMSTDEIAYFAQGGAKEDGFEVMLDSGAFSAKNVGATIELDEYMEFVSNYGHHFEGGYVALDVLGEPDQTQKNLDIMWTNKLNPMPVHVWGDTKQRMDELFERSSKVCLGGFRRPGRGPAPKEYVVEKMRMASGRPVHWLGYTNIDMVATLTPHSCDSISWQAAKIWGRCVFYKGNGRWSAISKDEATSRRFTKMELIHMNQLGLTQGQLRNTESWSGPKGPHARVTTLSWLKYVLQLRKELGTRMFLAFNAMHQVHEFKHAMKAIEEEK